MSHPMPPPRSVVTPLAALGGLIAWAYWPTLTVLSPTRPATEARIRVAVRSTSAEAS